MKKIFSILAVLALIATTAIADRQYALCDSAKSRLCVLALSVYEFEEATNSNRTSETGSAPFLEPDGANVTQGTGKVGTYDITLAASQYVYIPRTSSLGGSFTISLWVKFGTDPTDGQPLLYTRDANGTTVGSRLYWSNAAGVVKPVFLVKPGNGSTDVSVTWGSDVTSGVWHCIEFGIYANPVSTNFIQSTVWISVDNGTRVTVNVPWPPLVYIGDFRLSATAAGTLDVDHMLVFGGYLNTNDSTWLYNSGAGRAYPFTVNP